MRALQPPHHVARRASTATESEAGQRSAFLSTAIAGHGERMLAFAVMLVSTVVFVAAAPFARVPLSQLWAFIPIYQSALALNDLITAILLFAQFRILRSGALLALACGYLFTTGMVVVHTLSFPGLFSPTGLLGASPQTTAWLYMYWHGAFPLFVIAYAWLKHDMGDPGLPPGLVRTALFIGTLGVAIVVVGLALLATAGHALLPAIMRGNNYTPAMILVVSTVWSLGVVALLALWTRRPHSTLDLWLMVVMCAWIFDVALSAVLNAGRFDLGFYAGRIYGLLAATFVLGVMLFQTGTLYVRLARLLDAEQQERRHESEHRRRIFETSLDLILITDRQGRFLQVSPSAAAILGYDSSDMVGRSAIDFVYPEDLGPIRQQMRLARSGHDIRNFETRYLHKEGPVVTLVWSGVWSEPEQRYFFIGRDMTEQKRIDRLKGEFVATVSHELRTPITSIAGSLRLLESGASGQVPEPVKRLLGIALANSQRLARLINDILDIEKLEAGKVKFNLQRVDVKALVERAIEANAAYAESFGVDVRLAGDAARGVVRADPDRLTQVLINLLSNAVKYSPRGEEVLVAVRLEDDQVRITVRDHGPGIPDQFKGQLFEKFAQVDGTNTRRPGGTGLGLSIVKQIVVRLGGNIGYERAPGGGALFTVDLPQCGLPASSEQEPAELPRLRTA
jgi:PAS domain S-box-containing protein